MRPPQNDSNESAESEKSPTKDSWGTGSVGIVLHAPSFHVIGYNVQDTPSGKAAWSHTNSWRQFPAATQKYRRAAYVVTLGTAGVCFDTTWNPDAPGSDTEAETGPMQPGAE